MTKVTTIETITALPSDHVERQANWLHGIVRRNDAYLAEWAVEWLGLDLAAVWPMLDDDERDSLVSWGVVSEVQADVTCISAESWQDDWREDSNAAWPTYALMITADGMDDIEVVGWHLVGVLIPNGNRRYSEWGTEDSDGCGNGLPQIDGWCITAGDNVGGVTPISCWRGDDGQWCTLHRDHLSDRYHYGAIADAASDADHGGEPTWEDVNICDMETHEIRWIIRDNEIIEVAVLTGGIAGHKIEYWDKHGRDRITTEYYATAWATDQGDETFKDMGDAVQSLHDLADDSEAYTDYARAHAALARIACDAHDRPDGMDCGIDDSGLYVQPADDGDDARYHLDAGQCTRVIRHGWSSVMDDITESLGIRATLAGARQWQREMDEIIDNVDPFVSAGDSIAGGNCKAETERVRSLLCERLCGEVGAVRASVILALRDDAYTRRACRLAAQRWMEKR